MTTNLELTICIVFQVVAMALHGVKTVGAKLKLPLLDLI